jgi:hypothetical protein
MNVVTPCRALRFSIAGVLALILALAASRAAFGESPRVENVPALQRIDLHRNGGVGDEIAVTVGIPFAPGQLNDAALVRILDAQGREVAAHVEPTLFWYSTKRSIRAVRAQFRARLTNNADRFYFAFDAPRTLDAAGWPYADGLIDAEAGLKVPAVLGTLSAEWLTASLIAGPQQPAHPENAYDRFVDTQFAWAKALPTRESSAWLFDRTSTLFKQYVRTGRFDYLQAAALSYRFYMAHITRDAPLFRRACVGEFAFGEVKPCDAKYVYVEPILLAAGLIGDDSQHDPALIESMITVWRRHAAETYKRYDRVDQSFTERFAGLGLLETVAAYELTGKAGYLEEIDKRVDWLRSHQSANPDEQPPDGSWRNSWQTHEGAPYEPVYDVRGASPWMSENIADALWHAWLVTGDARIPPMLVAFGGYLERHGWIAADVLAQHAKEWGRDACSGPDGQMSWYWSSSLATPQTLIDLQTHNGKYTDQHNVELALPVALARFFTSDPVEAKAFEHRLALIAGSYATACAENSETARRFNWNNRSGGSAQWLMRHFPTPGTPPERPASIPLASQ